MSEINLIYRGDNANSTTAYIQALRDGEIQVVAANYDNASDTTTITVRGSISKHLIAEADAVTDADGKVVKQREP